MSDIVVTVPKNFDYGYEELRGLSAWLAEGDAPGEPYEGDLWTFSTFGAKPDIKPGERVYVACEGRIVGYAPLIELIFDSVGRGLGRIGLVRGGGAVAVSIPEKVIGFRGWRYRWWEYNQETPLDLSDVMRKVNEVTR